MSEGAEVMARLRKFWREHPDKAPMVDSPTYLRITRQITEQEYRTLLNERRVAFGLPPIQYADE